MRKPHLLEKAQRPTLPANTPKCNEQSHAAHEIEELDSLDGRIREPPPKTTSLPLGLRGRLRATLSGPDAGPSAPHAEAPDGPHDDYIAAQTSGPSLDEEAAQRFNQYVTVPLRDRLRDNFYNLQRDFVDGQVELYRRRLLSIFALLADYSSSAARDGRVADYVIPAVADYGSLSPNGILGLKQALLRSSLSRLS
jgi:hypothetical protein